SPLTAAVHVNCFPVFFLMWSGHFARPTGAPGKSLRNWARIVASTCLPSTVLDPPLHAATAATTQASAHTRPRDRCTRLRLPVSPAQPDTAAPRRECPS